MPVSELGSIRINQQPEQQPEYRDASPWGPIQHVEAHENIEGVVFVSTASHGGYWLSDVRRREAYRLLGDGKYVPFVGKHQGNQGEDAFRWLEEDEDAVLVVMIWPWSHPEQACFSALQTAKRMVESSNRYWESDEAKEFQARANSWHKHAKSEGLWRICSMSTPPAGSPDNSWAVSYRRLDGKYCRVLVQGYQSASWISQADLDRITLKVIESH